MQIYPLSSLLFLADEVRAAIGAAKVRLVKVGFEPTSMTTRAELLAQEVEYTGYPVGGAPIAGFMAPLISPVGGVSLDTPSVQFQTAAPYTTGDVAGGWWIETAVAPFDVIAIGAFPAPGIPFGQRGQGFPFAVTFLLPLSNF
jgi:hypothetical protein